jgi:hypothetical protein
VSNKNCGPFSLDTSRPFSYPPSVRKQLSIAGRRVMKITGRATYVLQGLLEDKAFGWSHQVTGRRQTALLEWEYEG